MPSGKGGKHRCRGGNKRVGENVHHPPAGEKRFTANVLISPKYSYPVLTREGLFYLHARAVLPSFCPRSTFVVNPVLRTGLTTKVELCASAPFAPGMLTGF